MIFNYRNIHDLIIGWAVKDPSLHEGLKRINTFLVDLSKFLNDPEFEKIRIGKATFISDRNQLSQASAMTQFCRVFNIANTTLTDSTPTLMLFQAETYDTDGMFSSLQPTKILFPTPGIYEVGAYITIEPVPSAVLAGCSIEILLNGTTVIGRTMIPHSSSRVYQITLHTCTIYSFSRNDYVECRVTQANDAVEDFSISAEVTGFWAHRLS